MIPGRIYGNQNKTASKKSNPTAFRRISVGIQQIPIGFRSIPTGIRWIPIGFLRIPIGIGCFPVGFVRIPIGFRAFPTGIRWIPIETRRIPTGFHRIPIGIGCFPIGIRRKGEISVLFRTKLTENQTIRGFTGIDSALNRTKLADFRNEIQPIVDFV